MSSQNVEAEKRSRNTTLAPAVSAEQGPSTPPDV